VPLALAVIPLQAQPSLFSTLGDQVCVLQHGADHRNRAPAGARKCEFPENDPAALERLAQGRERLARLAGNLFLPVLVPPWNRLPDALLPRLPASGFIGLSRYGARHASSGGLTHVNTHVDIIDWRTRGFLGEEACLDAASAHLSARRAGRAEAEPTGWLTHHGVHDAAAWDFLARLFEFTRELPSVAWRAGAGLFHKN
jgi:hypothetical protein